LKKKLIKELTNLWVGELASIVIFLFVYFTKIKGIVLQVFYPLLILCFILLQGSIYWLIVLQRFKGKNIRNHGKIFFIFKWIDLLLIIFTIPAIAFSNNNRVLFTMLGIFLSIFSFVEWINYFIVRLSYKNPKTLFEKVGSKTLQESKLAMEIKNRFKQPNSSLPS
jgi:hypothetical protein